jgi:hypothetical protein
MKYLNAHEVRELIRETYGLKISKSTFDKDRMNGVEARPAAPV